VEGTTGTPTRQHVTSVDAWTVTNEPNIAPMNTNLFIEPAPISGYLGAAAKVVVSLAAVHLY